DHYKGGRHKPEYDVQTGVPLEELRAVTEPLTNYPAGFHIHPKVKKLLEQRAGMGTGKHPVDYGMAEALAFATLAKEGIPIRFSGRKSLRVTFNQRPFVLWMSRTRRSMCLWSMLLPTRHAARFTTPRFPKLVCSVLNTATAAIIPRRWCFGRRSLATSPTSLRPSSISLSVPGKTNGACFPGLYCCFLTATKARDRNTPAPVSSASCNWRPA